MENAEASAAAIFNTIVNSIHSVALEPELGYSAPDMTMMMAQANVEELQKVDVLEQQKTEDEAKVEQPKTEDEEQPKKKMLRCLEIVCSEIA